MFIFVDESGSFVCSAHRDAWNAIAAYVIPERNRRKMDAALTALKHRSGASRGEEIKLKNLPDETSYFTFLADLDAIDGLLFAVLVDMGDHDVDSLKLHRDEQAVQQIAVGISKTEGDADRRGLKRLADQVAGLSPQLYVQLQCQIVLIDEIIRHASLYYVQRHPETLGHLRWRIDRKDVSRTAYELAIRPFRPYAVAASDPRIGPPFSDAYEAGADYRAFNRYRNTGPPGYLKEGYGTRAGGQPGFNIGRLCGENRRFEDSRTSPGVQIADLLASGLRRCLRREFTDTPQAAALLGGLMTQREMQRGKFVSAPPPVLHLSKAGGYVSQSTYRLMHNTMAPHARELRV